MKLQTALQFQVDTHARIKIPRFVWIGKIFCAQLRDDLLSHCNPF